MRRFGVLLPLALGCAACGHPESEPSAAASAKLRDTASAPAIAVAAAGEERTKLEAVVATVEGLLAEERLWDNFETVAKQYSKIYVGPDFSADGTTDPGGATALLRGRNSAYRFFPSQLTLTGTYYGMGDQYLGTCRNSSGATRSCRETEFSQNYSNESVVTHGIGLHPSNGPEMASMELGRVIFDRYNSPSVVRRSCTYNSVAHEWTHTIGKVNPKHASIIVDSGSNVPGGAPILSYLFGSVVQCTWLQDQKQVGSSSADLQACARTWSAKPFPNSQCV